MMTPAPLEIRHLRYFLAVAEAGSFSRAAARLGVSQPSVSQQIRDLENGLRVSLFQRRGRRTLLTSVGKILQEHAHAILRQVENLLDELSSEPRHLRGVLRVGIVPFLDVALAPHLLGLFAAAHPGMTISLQEISSTEIENAVEEGRMDVGLGFITRHSPNLRYERLCGDEIVLIVAETHPWASRRAIPLSQLHEQRLVQLPHSFIVRHMTDDICRKHQVRPRTVAEISAIETLLRSLGPLHAAALLPSVALRGTRGLKAIALRGKNLSVEIGLLRLIGSSGNAAVRAFCALAKADVPKLIGRKRGQRTSG
jgi:LysR family transcriptional regulator, cyn operon transcriptional activator